MTLLYLRIIDASLNRSSEGLRFLEDVARFSLEDDVLSGQLKNLRHSLVENAESLGVALVFQRDSEHDVGACKGSVTSGSQERTQPNLPALIRANAKRATESLRVLEELSKLPELSLRLDSAKFEQTRFNIYTLEQELLGKVLRQDKLGRLLGLYVILDVQSLAGRDVVEIATQVIQGGANVIQLRDKCGSKRELFHIAQKLKDLCADAGVLFIVNDYLDLALLVNADGLHLGQEDLPLVGTRRELPLDKIIGCSVHTVPQAVQAQSCGADYVAVGSMFASATKRSAAVVGIPVLRQVKQMVSFPVVAIGGINEDNVHQVVSAGADCIAVSNAVLAKDDVAGATRQLISQIDLTGGEL